MNDKRLQESHDELSRIVSRQEGELSNARVKIENLERELLEARRPIPMRLTCPVCSDLHVDEGEFRTKEHHTHACQSCGNVWRPAIRATFGVRFLPGFKNFPDEDDA